VGLNSDMEEYEESFCNCDLETSSMSPL